MLANQGKENPYYHRGPIRDPQQFYGREEELQSLLNLCKNKQCVEVVGERKIGKTSLLYQVLNRISGVQFFSDDPCVAVYLNPGLIATPREFFGRVFQSIEKRTLSPGIEVYKEIGQNNVHKLLKKWLGPRPLILLIDEFEKLVSKTSFMPGFYSYLRGLTQAPLDELDVRIVTASQTRLAVFCTPKVVGKYGSEFFNSFALCSLGAFAEGELVDFLTKTSGPFGVPMLDFKPEIIQLAGRFPFFVQIACWYYFQAFVEQGHSMSKTQVRQRFLDEATEHFDYIWRHLDRSERQLVLALASGGKVAKKRLRTLAQKGYVIDGNLFSSAFAESVMQTERGGPVPKQGVFVDEQSGGVWVSGDLLEPPLAELEYKLLAYLFKKRNQICSRYNIVLAVWGEEYIEKVDDARIDQLVRRVRLRIEPDPASPRYLETVRGRGYRLKMLLIQPPHTTSSGVRNIRAIS
jgi:DNA-binding winged helix-turn-helix (wHTH) protein